MLNRTVLHDSAELLVGRGLDPRRWRSERRDSQCADGRTTARFAYRLSAASVAALFAALSSGCAYLTTYKSEMDLANTSYSIDVKQRVVFTNVRESFDRDKDGKGSYIRKRVICAEPSPDALTTISASAGLDFLSSIGANANRQDASTTSGASTSSNQSAKVAAALSEQGAFIGLRTQSIQLLRDAMYRACEGFAAGAVSEVEFTAMQRRYQSTMLGLLAIEQLTRPVVAAQVVLASNANAQAGASPGDAAVAKAQQRLDEALGRETLTKVDVNTAAGARELAEKKLAENKLQERDERAKAEKAEPGDAVAKKAAGDQAVQGILAARPALEEEYGKKKKAEEGELIKQRDAGAAVRVAQAELSAARSVAAASASGGGQFGSGTSQASAQITADLVKGVSEIVTEINASYGRDGCFALMQSLVRDRPTDDQPITVQSKRDPSRTQETGSPYQLVLAETMRACGDILTNDALRTAQRTKAEADAIKTRAEADKTRFEFEQKMREEERKARAEFEEKRAKVQLQMAEEDRKFHLEVERIRAQAAEKARTTRPTTPNSGKSNDTPQSVKPSDQMPSQPGTKTPAPSPGGKS